MTISILCVDDNPAIAEALRCMIENERGMSWVGHLETADRLTPEAQGLEPDVVLLDLDLPGRPAFDALAELVQIVQDVRVIILSGHMSERLIDQALDAGAWGYVNKNEGPGAVIQAIHRVIAGECVFDLAIGEPR